MPQTLQIDPMLLITIIGVLVGVIWKQRNGMLKDLKDAIKELTDSLKEQHETNDKKHDKMWEVIRKVQNRVSKVEGFLKIEVLPEDL